jgi:MFS family permease
MQNELDARSKKRALTVFAGCCVMQMVGLGTVLNSSSAFFAVVPGAVGLGMGEFALWLTAYAVAALFATALAGTLYDRFGAKKVVTVTVIISAIAVYCFSFATTTIHFVIIGAVLGLTGGLYFLYACPVLIGAWFAKKRGTYLGIANLFSGIGGAIWPLIFTALFPMIGYKNVYLINAILLLVCILPFSLSVFSLNPEKSGLHAYGAEGGSAAAQVAASGQGISLGTAVKSAAFVLALIACALCAFPGCYNSYMQAYTISVLGPDFALFSATMMMALQLGYIIASPVSGALADKIGIKPVALGLIALTILCYFGFTITRTTLSLLVCAFFFGMNNAMVTISVPLLVRDWFAGPGYDKMLGYCMAGVGLVGGMAAPIIGITYDATGNYNMGFIVGAAIAAVSACFILLTYVSNKKLKQRFEQ